MAIGLSACGKLPPHSRFVAPSAAAYAIALANPISQIRAELAVRRTAASNGRRTESVAGGLTNVELISILQHAIYDLNPDDTDYGGTIAPLFDKLQAFVNDASSAAPSAQTTSQLNAMLASISQYGVDGGGRIATSNSRHAESQAGDDAVATAWGAAIAGVIVAVIIGAPVVVTAGAAAAVCGLVVYIIAALNPNLPANPTATAIADGVEATGFFQGGAAVFLKGLASAPAALTGMIAGGFLGLIKFEIEQNSVHVHTVPWTSNQDFWTQGMQGAGTWVFFSSGAGYHVTVSCCFPVPPAPATPPPSGGGHLKL